MSQSPNWTRFDRLSIGMAEIPAGPNTILQGGATPTLLELPASSSRPARYAVMPSSFAAVPPSIATRSASLNPGVARM